MTLAIFITFFLNIIPLNLSLEKPLLLSEAEKYDQKVVQVTGFLYEHPDGYQILAHQPDLKSCCLGSSSLTHQQLIIQNAVSPKLTAVKMEGIFHLVKLINTKNEETSFFYELKDAKMIEKSQPIVIYICFAVISIFLIILFRKKIFKN